MKNRSSYTYQWGTCEVVIPGVASYKLQVKGLFEKT
jgi:hypothetical protein